MAPGSRPRVALTMTQCWHRTPGGTARAGNGMAVALAERDDLDLVGVGPMGVGRWGRPPRPGWEPPIPTRHLPAPHQVLYETWHRWRRPSVRWAAGRVDLLHATSVMVPPRPRRRPLVVTVHDLFPLRYPDQFTSIGRAMLTRGIELARTEADLVLCSSDATRRDCLDHGFDEARLRTVPLGAAAVPVSPGEVAEVRARHGLEGPFALWVGTVEPRKNLATLTAAFAQVDPALGPLALVGPAGWHVDLAALIEPLGDRVRVLGAVSEADLHALYRASTVTVLPSHAEGFGFTALEAMAQGTPAVVSAGSASEEVVAGSGTVLPATDVDAWADAISAALADPDAAAARGDAALARAAELTWDRTAGLVVAAYRELLGP